MAIDPTCLNAPPRPDVMERSAGLVLTPPSSRSMEDRMPFMEGLIWTHAVPRLKPAIAAPLYRVVCQVMVSPALSP